MKRKDIHVDVSKNSGTPKMDGENTVMENPINPWMIWGYHYF